MCAQIAIITFMLVTCLFVLSFYAGYFLCGPTFFDLSLFLYEAFCYVGYMYVLTSNIL